MHALVILTKEMWNCEVHEMWIGLYILIHQHQRKNNDTLAQ